MLELVGLKKMRFASSLDLALIEQSHEDVAIRLAEGLKLAVNRR
jgi:hypothetical protein